MVLCKLFAIQCRLSTLTFLKLIIQLKLWALQLKVDYLSFRILIIEKCYALKKTAESVGIMQTLTFERYTKAHFNWLGA